VDTLIRSADLVLRLWTVADKSTIDEIVCSSRTEFDSWLPGMKSDLADLDAFLEHVERSAEQEVGWYFGIELDGAVVGQCSLNARGDGTAEIGYWIGTVRTNEGIATRAVRALSNAAADHGFETLVIHCDEGNQRSAAVARKAGFAHVDTVALDPSLPRTTAQTGREMTWRLALPLHR
jgi:ribosomal-protein-serine acetyltransferase